MSLFYSLTLGTKAMAAQQNAMEVAGHNLSNVNTPGYSRQRVTMVTSEPETFNTPSGSFQVGTGVEIANISRVHDDFLDTQLQAETHDFGYYDTTYANYKIIETSFNEPSDSGIGNALDEFWQSWQKLAAPNPGDRSAREEVKTKAVKLTDAIKTTHQSLVELQNNVDSAIKSKTTDINTMLQKIAGINDQLANIPLRTEPSDLLDKRDQLLLELAQQMNFSANIQPNRTVDVSLGGVPLVVDNQAYPLSNVKVNGAAFNAIKDASNQNINSSFTSGEMAGLLNMRDNVITGYINDLNDLTSNIISRVNDVHAQGYDLNGNKGINFFTGTDANSIAVQSSILSNVNYIAVSSSKNNLTGNGQIAQAIADIQNEKNFENNSSTVFDFYQNMIAKQANDASYINNMKDNQQTLINGINERKASVSGVSIDEEMTSLIQYEQSYAAAAKYVSTVNQTIDTMMNMIK